VFYSTGFINISCLSTLLEKKIESSCLKSPLTIWLFHIFIHVCVRRGLSTSFTCFSMKLRLPKNSLKFRFCKDTCLIPTCYKHFPPTFVRSVSSIICFCFVFRAIHLLGGHPTTKATPVFFK
jgi:hypothetical protein